MKFSLPRGMRDLGPDDFGVVENIRNTFLEVARLFGFKLMEPSSIELLSTLEAKSGPDIVNEIYCFKDKAGRDVGLRFDLTVGLTRFVASRRGLKLPIKLCSFSSMWRYDEPQYGRYRWFYQWDAEVFGTQSVEADAEIIELTSLVLNRLGLKGCTIEVGDRRIVEEYVRRELRTEDQGTILEALRAMDKVKKKPLKILIGEYAEKGMDEEALKKLTEFGRVKGRPDETISLLREKGLQGFDGVMRLVEALEARSVKDVLLNMGIVRGLDYYTSIVFEAFDPEHEEVGALAGGGRFDTLPTIFGRPDLTATGVAGGVERQILALSKRGLIRGRKKTMVYVVYANEPLSGVAQRLASELRKQGVPAETDLLRRSLNRQMEAAASLSSPYVMIVAPKEFAQGKIILKRMEDGVEKQMAFDEAVAFLKTD